jgi:hypothetical protein
VFEHPVEEGQASLEEDRIVEVNLNRQKRLQGVDSISTGGIASWM